jgi:4-diphosphocytidyl-2-C-methyl-D-erythritol kinase
VIVCHAYAKVNLTLEVLGPRADGFHEIVSLVQAVNLHDSLRLAPANDLAFACSDPSIGGEDNLALRAAELLRRRVRVSQGADMLLEKRIPVAAGLGGGSADAMAALVGLRRLWNLAVPDEELLAMAASLGSDVPFFLHGGTGLLRGRGEDVAPLAEAPARWLVLLRPANSNLANKTATLYRRLSAADYDDGAATRDCLEVLARGEFPAENLLRNTFEKVAYDAFPGLSEARERLRAAGGSSVHLSGAGPSLFSVFAEREPAEQARRTLRAAGDEAYLVRTGPWRSEPSAGP